MTRQFTAIIEREGDGYVGLCPELDVASQGATVAETRASLVGLPGRSITSFRDADPRWRAW